MMEERRPVVALTGASGYIGSNLLKRIEKYADVIALSRSGGRYKNTEQVTWRPCDLFSLPETNAGLQGADIAVYLVHSMMPSAKLTQGTFADMDVILADNFARAAKKNGVKKIIYLTGIIPEGEQYLSRHLQSRLEVERILGSYGIPVTAVRAGLIVGPKGSSFPILSKLVKRLPVMLLPKWTRTPAQPTALTDVLDTLEQAIQDEDNTGKMQEVGGPEVMTYRDMMQETAQLLGRQPKLLNLPLMTPKLSRLWVTLITGAPKAMTYPLIESLPHQMIAKQPTAHIGSVSFRQAAKQALAEDAQHARKKQSKLELPSAPDDVRSVQRILMPKGKSAEWIARYYVHWLDALAPFISTNIDADGICTVSVKFIKKPILKMAYSKVDSTEDRALFYIIGGLLAKVSENKKGRLEFRRIPNTNEGIVAIHDYLPSLPWFFYYYTQAKIHLLVMAAFRWHLKKVFRYIAATKPALGS